jgi:hypothetical protein
VAGVTADEHYRCAENPYKFTEFTDEAGSE